MFISAMQHKLVDGLPVPTGAPDLDEPDLLAQGYRKIFVSGNEGIVCIKVFRRDRDQAMAMVYQFGRDSWLIHLDNWFDVIKLYGLHSDKLQARMDSSAAITDDLPF